MNSSWRGTLTRIPNLGTPPWTVTSWIMTHTSRWLSKGCHRWRQQDYLLCYHSLHWSLLPSNGFSLSLEDLLYIWFWVPPLLLDLWCGFIAQSQNGILPYIELFSKIEEKYIFCNNFIWYQFIIYFICLFKSDQIIWKTYILIM